MSVCWVLVTVLASCQITPAGRMESNADVNPFIEMVRFYQGPLNHLSAVRTGQCPMYPSDSEYSLEALEKHGMFMGLIMSIDRLMRCGRDETRLAPAIGVCGQLKTYDPVTDNDFWWYGAVRKTDTPPQALNRKPE